MSNKLFNETRTHNYLDQRERLMRSLKKIDYAQMFLRVVKSGFGQSVNAEVFTSAHGFQMVVFYLDGKRRQGAAVKRVGRANRFFAEQFKLGIAAARRAKSPISYHSAGFLEFPVVVIVRKRSDFNKKNAFKDAKRVCGEIVRSLDPRCAGTDTIRFFSHK